MSKLTHDCLVRLYEQKHATEQQLQAAIEHHDYSYSSCQLIHVLTIELNRIEGLIDAVWKAVK